MFEIYYYNLSFVKVQELAKICQKMSLTMREVKKSQQHLKIMDVIFGSNNEVLGPSFDEELILIRLDDSKLDELLNNMKALNLKIEYKAMLTPYNVDWTSYYLLNELKKEEKIINKK